MKRLLLAATLTIALAAPAAADYWADFEAAIDAYAEGRHDDALARFRPLAEGGDNRAQYWLGMIYFEGKGVPRDDRRAYYWLTLAAEGGNRAARRARDGIAGRMSDDEIAEAERLVASGRPTQD